MAREAHHAEDTEAKCKKGRVVEMIGEEYRKLTDDIMTMIHAGMSYGAIGKKYKVNKGIIWNIINTCSGEPKDPDIRAKLGLPAIAPVTFITTVNTEGESVQAHTVARCNCGQHFVPNTGKRDQCFTCEPFRSRKE